MRSNWNDLKPGIFLVRVLHCRVFLPPSPKTREKIFRMLWYWMVKDGKSARNVELLMTSPIIQAYGAKMFQYETMRRLISVPKWNNFSPKENLYAEAYEVSCARIDQEFRDCEISGWPSKNQEKYTETSPYWPGSYASEIRARHSPLPPGMPRSSSPWTSLRTGLQKTDVYNSSP